MFRIIDDKLIKWKTNSLRKPLLLRGARQVGKTYSVIQFGKNNFESLHKLDFERNPELHQIFEKDKNPQRILRELGIFLNKKIKIGSDLIFFDEIQNSPPALSALRYFYEEIPELHVVAAGSLIEFVLKKISFPVGRVEIISMHPMNFYEYLSATNNKILMEYYSQPLPDIPDIFHDLMLKELRKYFLIGGMPEVVNSFIETNSFIDAFKVQNNLIQTFKHDFSKYGGRSDKKNLEEVLVSLAKNTGSQIKYVNLADGFSIPTIKKAFNLLYDAGLVTKIDSVNPTGIPLGATASNKIFKSLFLDIGLMNSMCGLQFNSTDLHSDLMALYKGRLAEQFVGQEILSSEINGLYYWSRNKKSSSAEIDYLFNHNNEIIPIEVKSSSAGRLRSMHLLLETYRNIKSGFVLSTARHSSLPEQKLEFIPLYFAYRLASKGKIN